MTPTRPRAKLAVLAVAVTAGLIGTGVLPAHAEPVPAPSGGVLGWGFPTMQRASIQPDAASGVTQIALGAYHGLALKQDGTAVLIGGAALDAVPASVQGHLVAVDAGTASVGLTDQGGVVAWGILAKADANVPVAAQSGVKKISAGYGYALALKDDGSVIAWGANDFGESDVPAAALHDVIAVDAGGDHSLALKKDGSVIAWGANTTTSESGLTNQSVVPAEAGEGVIAIAAGYSHSLALKKDGSIVAWGSNSVVQETSVPAGAGRGAVAIAAGWFFSMVLTASESTITGAPSAGVVGQPYAQSYSVVGAGATTAVTGGSLPPGVTLSGDGLLSGTPTAAGVYTFTVTASNPGVVPASVTSTVTVNPATTARAVVVAPLPSVQAGAAESDTEIRVFAEQTGTVLTRALTVGGKTIPAGTKVNSYYVHADRVGASSRNLSLSGSVSFGSKILAVASTTASLRATAPLLGSPTTAYGTASDQGLEYNDVAGTGSTVGKINLTFNVSSGTDAVRVITLAP